MPLHRVLFERNPFDHQWLLGGANVWIDFNQNPPLFYDQTRPIRFDFTNASICDGEGQLLFYTNGISVANGNGQIMENGERINPGSFTDGWVNIGNLLYKEH
ncbi:MAG: hypothetical protein R2795_24895 [Saprospiraceae bacterium]